MKKLLLTTALVMLAMPAHATYYKKGDNTNVNYNKSYNQNYNKNFNHNKNHNHNNNVNVNKNVSKSKATSNANATSRSKAKSNSNSNATGGNANVTNVENTDIPVSTAYAPSLTSSNDTCMGSSSLGGQGAGFGISLGSTWEDEDCRRRKNARFLYNVGSKASAIALMCEDTEVANAIMKSGTHAEKMACSGGTMEVEPVQRADKIFNKSLRKQPTYNE